MRSLRFWQKYGMTRKEAIKWMRMVNRAGRQSHKLTRNLYNGCRLPEPF